MNGKLVFAFLLTIATFFSNTSAVPVSNDFQTINVKDLPRDRIFPGICLIPCRNTNTGKVCGSDGQTYPDIGFISCKQACGSRISKAYDGECKPNKKTGCKKEKKSTL